MYVVDGLMLAPSTMVEYAMLTIHFMFGRVQLKHLPMHTVWASIPRKPFYQTSVNASLVAPSAAYAQLPLLFFIQTCPFSSLVFRLGRGSGGGNHANG